MDRNFTLERGSKPSPEQLREIKEAAKYPITFDKDCEELSPTVIRIFLNTASDRKKKEM